MADPIRVLYIDDDRVYLETGKLYLEKESQFSIDTATSVKSVLPLLNSKNYDAIISDYQMPGMDGIGFLKRVKASGNSIPFIIFTGRGREEVVTQALNEGADYYLQKGGDPEAQFTELAHKIRMAVDRRRIDLALKANEEKYRHIVETSHDGVWAMDEHFVTTYVNNRMAEMLGYPVAEILGKTITSFISAEELADNQVKLGQRMNRQPGSYERRFRAKDGTLRTFHVSATPLMGDDGSFNGSFAMLADITDRKRAEEEILRKNDDLHASYEQIAAAEEELRAQFDALAESEKRNRETLAAFKRVTQKINILSQLTRQDITTQIYIMRSHLEIAKDKAAGSEVAVRSIESGQRVLEEFKTITEFIKDFQNMGEKPPRWLNVKLMMLMGLSHMDPVNFKISFETDNLEIFADPLLEKAFQGILENSVMHGGHVSEIRVTYIIVPDGITIVFEDNGVGIPPEKKEMIFFHETGSRVSVRGLFFVREILDITGITIRETGEPEKGARFEMVVPKGTYRLTADKYIKKIPDEG